MEKDKSRTRDIRGMAEVVDIDRIRQIQANGGEDQVEAAPTIPALGVMVARADDYPQAEEYGTNVIGFMYETHEGELVISRFVMTDEAAMHVLIELQQLQRETQLEEAEHPGPLVSMDDLGHLLEEVMGEGS